MADDNNVPPLEDMSSVLDQILSSRDIKNDNSSSNRRPVVASSGISIADSCTGDGRNSSAVAVSTQCGEDTSKQSKAKPPHQNSGDAGFGGLKKGFLFSGNSKASSASATSNCTKTTPAGRAQKTQDENIPFIKANKDSTAGQHRFDEVQQAMQVNDAFAMNKEWLTEDLLQQIQSNSELCRRLQDPTFMQAIAEFQANPQAAMQKYSDNAAMQTFFREFCGILGDHFSSLGSKQPASASNTTIGVNEVHVHPPQDVAEISISNPCQVNRQRNQANADADPEDARVREILSDSKMREILMDSKIQQLMTCLQNDRDRAQVLLRNADSDLRGKVNCLISSGLLQFQS